MFGSTFRDVTLTEEQRQEVGAATQALRAVCEKYNVPMACVVTLAQRVTEEAVQQEVSCTGICVSANPITSIVGSLSQDRSGVALVKLMEYMSAERDSRA